MLCEVELVEPPTLYHLIQVWKMLGLPAACEFDLAWADQQICHAQRPKCAQCSLYEQCAYVGSVNVQETALSGEALPQATQGISELL